MKLVAAAFGNEIDYRPLRLAIFRAEAVSLHPELLNRIDGRKDQERRVRTDVHIVHAVDRPQVGI